MRIVDAAGTVLWQTGAGGSAPIHLWLKKDETVAEAVGKTNRPDPGWFERYAGLPDRVQKGGSGATLGRTPLTAAGSGKDAR